jgi:hypothetical protein
MYIHISKNKLVLFAIYRTFINAQRECITELELYERNIMNVNPMMCWLNYSSFTTVPSRVMPLKPLIIAN